MVRSSDRPESPGSHRQLARPHTATPRPTRWRSAPARWFGPALISNEWGGVWPYVVGPIVGAILAILVYRLIEPSDRAGVQRPLEPKAMGDIKKDSPAAGAKADPKDSKA